MKGLPKYRAKSPMWSTTLLLQRERRLARRAPRIPTGFVTTNDDDWRITMDALARQERPRPPSLASVWGEVLSGSDHESEPGAHPR